MLSLKKQSKGKRRKTYSVPSLFSSNSKSQSNQIKPQKPLPVMMLRNPSSKPKKQKKISTFSFSQLNTRE
jgi:hypothetical protein